MKEVETNQMHTGLLVFYYTTNPRTVSFYYSTSRLRSHTVNDRWTMWRKNKSSKERKLRKWRKVREIWSGKEALRGLMEGCSVRVSSVLCLLPCRAGAGRTESMVVGHSGPFYAEGFPSLLCIEPLGLSRRD